MAAIFIYEPVARTFPCSPRPEMEMPLHHPPWLFLLTLVIPLASAHRELSAEPKAYKTKSIPITQTVPAALGETISSVIKVLMRRQFPVWDCHHCSPPSLPWNTES